MKKIISLILICCMVMPMICASAADMPEAQPTIEEILNSYHEKAFAAQTAGDAGASTWSSRSGKTLEEETVDELTAAGYEAYYVTRENYYALEESLHDDFAAKGMNPEGRYIFIVHQGDEASPANARLGSLPEQEIIDGGDNSFLYYDDYYQRWYTMRKKTVVQTSFIQNESVNLHNSLSSALLDGLADGSISLYVKSEYSLVRMGVTSDIFGIEPAATYLCENLVLQASATWVRTFYDVWDEHIGLWSTPFYTEFANFSLEFTGRYYNAATHSDVPIFADCNGTSYAPYYYNSERLKLLAVAAFHGFDDVIDRTENLIIGFVETNGTIPTTILPADFIAVLTIYENF